jgi:hypothetical protein
VSPPLAAAVSVVSVGAALSAAALEERENGASALDPLADVSFLDPGYHQGGAVRAVTLMMMIVVVVSVYSFLRVRASLSLSLSHTHTYTPTPTHPHTLSL